MTKLSTNIGLNSDVKKEERELTLTTTHENPNTETVAALNEYYEMKAHPENYMRYSSFKDAMNDVLTEP